MVYFFVGRRLRSPICVFNTFTLAFTKTLYIFASNQNKMELKEYVKNAHKNAKEKGFWDEEHPNIGEKLMLIVTELAEAMEALRGRNRPSYADIAEYRDNIESKGILFDRDLFQVNCKDSLEDELADTLIRTFDLCGYLNIDIEFHINQKMKYNATREKLHGKKF